MLATMPNNPRTVWRLGRIDLQIVAVTVLAKVCLFVLGVVIVALLGDVIRPDGGRVSGDPRLLFGPWVRWDAPHYLDLAVFGYRSIDPGDLASPTGYRSINPGDLPFYIVILPLYPWLVGALNALLNDPTVSALVISGIASLFVGPLLFRLVALDEGAIIARRSVWFLLLFPTAYFLHIGYTESLFIALSLGSMLAARLDRWWLAGALGGLATLTRINGLILVPVLAVEAAMQWWPDRRWRWRWLAIGLVPFAFVGYLGLNQVVYGDPLAFVEVQSSHWQKSLSPPWVGIGALLASDLPRAWIPELAFIVLGIAGTVASAVRLRPSWTVWMAGNLVLFTSTSFVLSVPRYSLVLFPLFVWFAILAGSRRTGVLMASASAILLIVLAGRFALGAWAF